MAWLFDIHKGHHRLLNLDGMRSITADDADNEIVYEHTDGRQWVTQIDRENDEGPTTATEAVAMIASGLDRGEVVIPKATYGKDVLQDLRDEVLKLRGRVSDLERTQELTKGVT